MRAAVWSSAARRAPLPPTSSAREAHPARADGWRYSPGYAARRLAAWLDGGAVRTLRDSLAPFLTVDLPWDPMKVRGPDGVVTSRCNRQGHLDLPIDLVGLAPGWHELTVTTTWRGSSAAVPVPVLVVDPDAPLAAISDVDDTVIETGGG
jgi:phosphatidate phosphatase APP1